MEAGIRELIDSYKSGMATYSGKLSNNNPILKEVETLMNQMEALGEENDYMGFMTKAQELGIFHKIIQLQAQLASESAKVSKNDSGNLKIPSPKEIAIAYHNAYDSIPEDYRSKEIRSIYEKVFHWEEVSKSAAEFIMHLEEEDLYLGMSRVHLAEVMRKGLKDMLSAGSNWTESGMGVISNPQMEKYFETMEEAMLSAKSLLEMELLAISEAENSRFSNLWDTIFIQSILLELVSPISAWKMAKTESNRLNVVSSYYYLCEFWGLRWEQFFQIPRVWDFFEKSIYYPSQDKLRNLGINTIQDFIKDLKSDLDACLKNNQRTLDLDTSKQIVLFRGKEIPLNETLHALKTASLSKTS